MFHDGFVDTLADFCERGGGQTPFAALRLCLLSATGPEWLVRPLGTRPLLATTRELPDFTPEELLRLARLHRLDPDETELAALRALVGGQPYLSRVALYAAAVRGETLGEVLRSRPQGRSVFDPYLEACQRRVAAQPGLWPTLLRVLREEPLEALDRLLLPRLWRMGIVRREGPGDPHPEYALRYPLYRRLLDL
jgi:hypothetical protein